MGMDCVELVMDVEKAFSVTIRDEDAVNLGVVGDLARHVIVISKQQNQVELEFDPVLRTIIRLLSNYGIPAHYVNSTTHVVHDLGLD